jgi:hypothetical protein
MESWSHGGGFSLDATVRIAANDRHGLERLLCYCARPPFAAERLHELDRHRLIYHVPKPGPDGRTQLILSPLELIERIAALHLCCLFLDTCPSSNTTTPFPMLPSACLPQGALHPVLDDVQQTVDRGLATADIWL